MAKVNICVIGLSKQFTDDVCKQLSIKMDMFYANVQEILEFELMDIERVEQVCGVDYVQKEERSIIRRLCTYDNTLINLDYSCLNNESNLEVVRDNCLIIYIKLDEKRFIKEQDKENITNNVKEINRDLFHDRDFLCSNFADISVDCYDYEDDELTNSIIQKIMKYYTI